MIRPSGLLFRSKVTAIPSTLVDPAREPAHGPVGCWIMAQESLGPMPETSLFWHMSTYHAPWQAVRRAAWEAGRERAAWEPLKVHSRTDARATPGTREAE